MRMKVVMAAVAALASSAHGATKTEAPFESVRAAYAAFGATTNSSVRQSAYAYAKDAVLRSGGGPSARDDVWNLRLMARALGMEGDCVDACARVASTTNSAARLAALTWLCDVARGWDADKATALVDRWLARAGEDVEAKALLFCRRMEARRKAGDAEGAEAAAASVMSLGADAPWPHYSQACFFCAEALAKKGDAAAAEKMLVRLLGRVEVASPGVGRRLAGIGIGKELALQFVSAMRRRISDVPVGDLRTFNVRAQIGEAEIVELLVYAGRLDEALGECRVMLLAAGSQPAYGNAVRLTADVLKRIDGNLGRAGAFLESQKSNHVALAVSPVPAYPALSDPLRSAEREKCLAYAKENAADWNAQLACAYRLLWADCAEDSIRVAIDAFAVAPFSEKSLQACADAAMHPFSVMTRDPVKVAAVRDYMLYGGAGRDGVAGTSDDLVHPVEFYRSCFRRGTGDPK